LGGRELGGRVGHVEQAVFEGLGGLGELDEADAVIERDLRNRVGGRARDVQPVTDDLAGETVVRESRRELDRLWGHGGDADVAAGGDGFEGLGGEQLAGTDDHEVIGEHGELADEVPEVIDLTEPATADDAEDEWSLPAVRLLVKVLGVPTIRDRPQLGRRELMVVVYVACASRPVTQDDIQDAIWGGDPVSEKTVANLVGHTRTVLGEWDHQPILSRARTGTMRLAHGVFTDHQLFALLAERAAQVPSSQAAPLLHQALDLIDGPPFNADGFEWAHVSQLVIDIETRIERAVLDLVALELDAGDVEEARRAVLQGLRALPGNEILYRERIRIEEAAGNMKAARSALMELIYYLEDLGTEPSTPTIAQYGHLIGDRQRR
jgi:DNA-binding SARP family transcriptional activator